MTRRRCVSTSALAALLLAPAPTRASNGNIGLFFDQGAATCQQSVGCGQTATIYVYALLGGASSLGITAVEYKVRIGPDDLADPGWFFLETFDPSATVIGSGAFTPPDAPFSQRGIDIAWPACQVGDGSKILIETVHVYNSSSCDPAAELALKVVKHDVPSHFLFFCPLFVLCDAPVNTAVCLGSNVVECPNPGPLGINAYCSTSGEAFLNGSRPCTVGSQPASWGTVKSLFRR